MKQITNNIGNLDGTFNQTDSGDITSTNIINKSDKESLISIIDEFKNKISSFNEISIDQREDVLDDSDIIKEEISKENCSKRRVEKALDRIKKIFSKLPSITSGATIILENFDKIKSIIEQNIN